MACGVRLLCQVQTLQQLCHNLRVVVGQDCHCITGFQLKLSKCTNIQRQLHNTFCFGDGIGGHQLFDLSDGNCSGCVISTKKWKLQRVTTIQLTTWRTRSLKGSSYRYLKRIIPYYVTYQFICGEDDFEIAFQGLSGHIFIQRKVAYIQISWIFRMLRAGHSVVVDKCGHILQV